MYRIKYRSGRRINWNKPPAPHKIVVWTKKDINGKRIKGDFRSICHLDRLNHLAKRRFGKELQVIQQDYNTSVSASAGTHDYSSVYDIYIPGVHWWHQQRFFRANGFACWYRHEPQFGNHIHGFTLPPQTRDRSHGFRHLGLKVGEYIDGGVSLYGYKKASSQIQDYYNRAFGLAGEHTPNSDKSWHPKNHGGVKRTIFNHQAYIKRRQS